MWNDTDIPLAHLITFRSYGTWLHGDPRGSVNRVRNRYQTPYLPPNRERLQENLKRLAGRIVTLDAKQRQATESAIRETCAARKWLLRAINVRTNHVHVVVSIGLQNQDARLTLSKRMRRERCDKKVVGFQSEARGLRRGVSAGYGTNAAWKKRSTM